MRLFKVGAEGKNELIPSKFIQDSEGNYWESRGKVGGADFLVPAPEWAGNINFYLFEGPNIFIEPTRKPLCDVPALKAGGKVADGVRDTPEGKRGNLILTDEEKNELLRTDPHAEKFIRPYMMGKDFINRISRWCLWLKGVEPADIRKCPRVLERIERVREFRLSSKKEATRKKADTPMLFDEPIECSTDYLAIPKTSSSNRKYIPIAWLPREVIAGDGIFMCEKINLYHFGVLSSIVHNAWVRKISGRLGMSYRYSNTIDYNAFPWPVLRSIPTKPGQPPKIHPSIPEIESTAQAILDARVLYPRSSLADLYDERTMPPELRRAHQKNDEAVMRAYGFRRHYDDERAHEEDIVIQLMYMYQELTGCEEGSDSYPNREFFRSYFCDDEDESEYEDED